MKHLTNEEFVDLIENALPAARAGHLEECARCRDQAAALRATLDEAAAGEWAEPSPLFWDHFGARVASAIADAPAPSALPGWTAWLRTPAVTWAAAASLAMVLMVGALWRATSVPQTSVPDRATATASVAPAAVDWLDDMNLDEDAAWALVRSAADDFVWEDAQAIGMAARPGSAERAVGELSKAERAELARLLENELKRSGA